MNEEWKIAEQMVGNLAIIIHRNLEWQAIRYKSLFGEKEQIEENGNI